MREGRSDRAGEPVQDDTVQRLRPSGGYRNLRGRPAGSEMAAAGYAAWLNHPGPAVVANALICLIHQANYLLDRQIYALERAFVREGGYSERLAAARLAERARQRRQRTDPTDPTDRSDPATPTCPACGQRMLLRTARQTGSRFWGCADFPRCKATRPLDLA